MRRLIFLAAICTSLLPTSTNAGVIGETIVGFPESKTLDGVDFNGFVINWSTDRMTGPIAAPNLTSLSVSLTSNGTPVYTDVAIINNEPQRIAGFVRTFSSINFGYNLDVSPGVLTSFDNDRFLAQIREGAKTKTYRIALTSSGSASEVSVTTDGADKTRPQQSLTVTNSTQSSTTAVPEPSAFLFLGLVGLGVGAWKRVTRHHSVS